MTSPEASSDPAAELKSTPVSQAGELQASLELTDDETSANPYEPESRNLMTKNCWTSS